MRTYRVALTEQSRGVFTPRIIATDEHGAEQWLPDSYATVKQAEIAIGVPDTVL